MIQRFFVWVSSRHTATIFFANEQEIEQGKSSLKQSLNGLRKFCYAKNAGERPEDFYKMDFDITDFDEITVPCHIEMAGYDKIHYINTMYPWEGHFYRRPAYSLREEAALAKEEWKGMFSEASYNPVGSYVREFDLEEGLLGKRITICFEGVEQAMYVWLNGHFIGYAEDSFTPSEFDLTPYVKDKGNRLAVEVHKRSTAAFLEDQDFFRFFGIFCNVVLHGKPRMHIEDLWVKPTLCEKEKGCLSIDLEISADDKVIYGDCTLGIRGRAGKREFHYIFSYQTGGLESLCINGKEWLYRTPKPTFWRALTDNDRGSGFHLKSGCWLSADLFMRCAQIEVWVDGKEIPLPQAPINKRYGQEESAANWRLFLLMKRLLCPRQG